MAKGGNGGGKPGGGDGGGGDSGTLLIKGGRGDDFLILPEDRTILNTAFDGGRGNDTLDLSSHSDGVTVKLNNGTGSGQSIVSPDDFTGTMWSLQNYAVLSDRIDGTIKNVENIIGTSGNDRLAIDDAGPNRIDGGAGNDALTVVTGGGDTLIGGSGEDWLLSYHQGGVLVGGTWGADGPAGDGERDVFSLTTGTILDFELGVDQIMIELNDYAAMEAITAATWTYGEWVDSDGVVRSGAQLQVAEGHVINLAGVDPADANAQITIGFVVATFGEAPVHGGPGDDILYGSNLADTFVIGPDAGNDMIEHFDPSQDVLSFSGEAPAEDDWTDVQVNGMDAIRWTYDSGESSITILGVTTADAGSLVIDSVPEPALPMVSSFEADGYLF